MNAVDVKQARTALGLTQRGMASAMGTRLQTYQKWEYGTRNPSATAARLIVHYLWLRKHHEPVFYKAMRKYGAV